MTNEATSRNASANSTGHRTEPANQCRCASAAAYAPKPNHAPCPNETSPVWPTRILSAMQATAKMTTSVALVSVSPPASSTNGSAAHPSTAMTTGECKALIPRPPHAFGPYGFAAPRSFEAQDAFAEEAARPEEQHEHHQQVHRRLGGRRNEVH